MKRPCDYDQQNDPIPGLPTRRQAAFLERHDLDPEGQLDYYGAMSHINRFINARRQLAPTPRQIQLLKARGLWRDGMTRGEAFDLIRNKIIMD
jgi:hypothetical protein